MYTEGHSVHWRSLCTLEVTMHSTFYTLYCIILLYTLHCTLYRVHFRQYTGKCTLHAPWLDLSNLGSAVQVKVGAGAFRSEAAL